jgi:23S rRNA (adenine2503-C2)-methyltransferase
LANLDQVRKAVAILHHPEGANISLRKITLSTCGIIKGIQDLTENGPEVRLAVSLNSADESVRSSLMPISRKNPLEELKKALSAYQERRRKRITFEYVLFRGINDRNRDVELLVHFLKGLKGVINLIPYNPVEGADFQSPDKEDTRRFISLLEEASIQVVQRYRRGRGINGACGQLGVLR